MVIYQTYELFCQHRKSYGIFIAMHPPLHGCKKLGLKFTKIIAA
jgi:hypothetical protein